MTLKRVSLILSFLVLSSAFFHGRAETHSGKPEGPYYGQQPPVGEAVIFAPGAVSIEGRHEYALSFCPNGNELLFSTEIPDQAAAVFHSRVESGKWSIPRKIHLSGGKKKAEMEAFYTPDGKRIYFAPYDEGMDVRIWAVDRTDIGWLAPRQLGSPLADDPAFFPTATRDGNIYYTNLRERKVFCAEMAGDSVIGIRDADLELGMHAFIAPDESYVLVDGRLKDPGKADIFVAFRGQNGSWSRPVDLGPEVNTEYSETCPSLSLDGKYLFFSRYNEEGEVANIYWIDSGVIDRARNTTYED